MITPVISKDLLEYLQKLFPNKLPEYQLPAGQVEILMGQQKVIAHLQSQYLAQNRTVLRHN